ncbi:MAG: dihydroorotate dehydrogenase electron transfer subunit [Gammaproteobacteria bacterium]
MNHRNTIRVTDCEILDHIPYDGNQFVIRLHAPEIAGLAKPGSFVHIQTNSQLPMRRPISILRANTETGWIELMYRVFGEGTLLLSQRNKGEKISILGPIGNPFVLHENRPRPLLLGGGIGMPPMIYLADECRKFNGQLNPMVMIGSEVPFPFTLRPSHIMIPGMPDGVIASMPLLEDWQIPCRLTSLQGYPGCFDGYITDLARNWLDALADEQRQEVEIFSCGPHPMLEAVAKLANDYRLPCQVSLEELMACAVGGCAGCTVKVMTEDGPAMKRVCVDGPVFDARSVFLN